MLGKCGMFILPVILMIDSTTMITAFVPTAVVNTTTGPVQGQILKTVVNSVEYAVFNGIRYGKPPIGYLRFKPPVPVDRWTETLNATWPGHDCPQIDLAKNKLKGSEDCLFLNVYTTVTDLSKTPKNFKSVMVWIYGGGFLSGSYSDPRYHPDYLLEKDVVYVAINYRIGALGFLSLNHPNATGNAGLKDQVLGLKWVKANIEKFGGNPNNVTIFGQSAGAVSVGFHVLSEASAGLFHGAISMSGTPLVPWGFTLPDDAVFRAKTVGLFIGESSTNKDKLLKALYAVSVGQLVQIAPYISPATPFTPTFEDEKIATDAFLTECTINKYNTGNFTKVPQMLGFMEQEMVAFFSYIPVLAAMVDRALIIHPSSILGPIRALLGRTTDFITDFGINAFQFVTNGTTNLLFKSQIDTTQRLLAANNSDLPVYYYYVTFTTNTSLHNIEQNTPIVGAGHADDLGYIYHVPYAKYSYNLSDPTGLTIHRFTTMWTNFAKYGNPTPHWIDENSLGVTWPTSGCDGIALDIGFNLTVSSRPIDLTTRIFEAANYYILGGQNGCETRTKPATCKRKIGSLFSIDVPIFNEISRFH